MIGHVLDGRYRIDALIAEGGMSRVYLATHLQLGAEVVVKFLPADWAERPTARARLRREATVLGKLRHPGIVAAHDFGEDAAGPYLVMERIEGRTLRELAGGQALRLPFLATAFDQLLVALTAAHEAGVVHRDLKPENVMARHAGDQGWFIKVLDFGLAFVSEPESERITAAGTTPGTPLYMSPEQCHGRGVGAPTDIYAVGAMLYEALCGVPPFSSSSPAELMALQIFAAPPPFEERGVTAPPGLESLALSAMSKRADDRPTAPELRRRLKEALTGEDPEGRQASAAADKRVLGGQSREQRGLPRQSSHGSRDRLPPASAAAPDGPEIALFGFSPARATALREVLAVNGVRARLLVAPPEPGAVTECAAVMLGFSQGTVAQLVALRADPSFGERPLLVVDVPEAKLLPELIRAGASDAALSEKADALISRQVQRLIRRGR